jgi:hypothetical protein
MFDTSEEIIDFITKPERLCDENDEFQEMHFSDWLKECDAMMPLLPVDFFRSLYLKHAVKIAEGDIQLFRAIEAFKAYYDEVSCMSPFVYAEDYLYETYPSWQDGNIDFLKQHTSFTLYLRRMFNNYQDNSHDRNNESFEFPYCMKIKSVDHFMEDNDSTDFLNDPFSRSVMRRMYIFYPIEFNAFRYCKEYMLLHSDKTNKDLEALTFLPRVEKNEIWELANELAEMKDESGISFQNLITWLLKHQDLYKSFVRMKHGSDRSNFYNSPRNRFSEFYFMHYYSRLSIYLLIYQHPDVYDKLLIEAKQLHSNSEEFQTLNALTLKLTDSVYFPTSLYDPFFSIHIFFKEMNPLKGEAESCYVNASNLSATELMMFIQKQQRSKEK